MASSLFTNAYLVDFESVLNIPDNDGMQNMFKALESSGLRGFLGCKSVLYEPELEQFFDTALIQGGDITGAISGKYFSISPSRFAGVFELPTEGLSDFSDVPKNLVYDARKIFSKSGEPVVPHGKKKLLKYEYRLLNDILAKSITMKACSFDVVTNERFQVMTAIHFGLKVNWSKVLFGVLEEMVDRTVKKAKGYGAQISVLLNSDPALTMGEATPFPSSKILSPKTVLTYITTNHTSDARGQSYEGGKTPVAIVKRASKLKKKSESTSDATVEIVSEVVGSKKRPVGEGSEPVVPKKRRTTKIKASVSSANLDMASVAQGVVPLQVIAPTPAVTAAQPPAPKRKSRKRKLILSEGFDDENVEESIDVASVKVAGVNVEESIEKVSHVSAQVAPTTDEVDVIIGQILTETSKLTTDDTESGEQIFTETDVGDIVFGDSTADNPEELAQWLENYISEGAEQVNESDSDRVQGTVDTVDVEQLFETANVEEAEGSISPVVEKDLAKPVGSKHSAEELMSIDDLLLQIPDDMLLPSVTAVEITKIRLGEGNFRGGYPARETVALICGDVDFLVQLREKVMQDVIEFFHSFSLNKLTNIDALLELKEKEKLMLEWAETDSLETAVKRKVYILAKYREMLLRKFVESHRKYYTPGQSWTATASKIIDLLSVAHSKSHEDLIAQQKEHGLPVEQPCTSTFLDAYVGSGAVLAQFYSMAKSTCWVRPLVLIDGVWTPIQGTDFWRSSCKLSLFVNRKKLPETVIEDNFVPHVFFIEPVQYWGAAPSLIKTWGWARVCTDIVRYHMFGCLRPVREDVCTDIVVYNLGVERIPACFRSIFQQGIFTDSFVGYFRDSDVQNLSDFEESSSDGSTVYRSPSPLRDEPLALGPGIPTVAQEEQLYFVQSPESPPATSPCLETSTSSTSLSMHFDADDIPLDDTADIQTSLPVGRIEFVEAIDDLRTLLIQHETLRHSLQGIRQDNQRQGDSQLLHIDHFKKGVAAHGLNVIENFVYVKKELSAQDAKITALDGQIVAIRSEQLEFQAKIVRPGFV
ncbi:cell division control protein 2C [Dorcoceras hygrometricum]|uniref:Cell division control protein 2C n=1 Tax=Dorcoceras hygrometricum TaxID=472368 RepID=A0A2Z7CSC9_9LAMI|nr:cell division control protein 2C [Dorcoceras hygrometricum]